MAFIAVIQLVGPRADEVTDHEARTTTTVQGDLDFRRVSSVPPTLDASSTPSASWVDIDDDGDDDLYVLNGYGSLEEEPTPQANILYRNDGAGGLHPVPRHDLVGHVTFSGSGTWADYDNDGDLDLFVANQRGVDNDLFVNRGAGTFERLTRSPSASDGGRSFSASWVDIDGDGRLDLHVLNGRDSDQGEVDFVYRNTGDGRLERVDGLPFAREALRSGGGTWGDFDRDGDPDLFLPVYSTGEFGRLYRNDGSWAFTEITDDAGLGSGPLPNHPPASVAHWVDYDRDGDLDLFVGTSGGTIDFLYENDGDGYFERVTAGRVGLDATYVSDATWVDLDNDADLDLVVAAWGSASEIFLNDGQGRLRPARAGDFGAEVTFASSVSAADIDRDGDFDLFLTQWPINQAGGAPNLLYRNESETGHWIELDLEGTRSNRSAIGAMVTVTAEVGDEVVRQLRHVTTRSSWRSAGGLRLHFGLGDAESVRRVEVEWPSGATNVIDGPIEVNQRLELVERRSDTAGHSHPGIP